MAKIDQLLSKMAENKVTRIVLVSDQPMRVFANGRETQGTAITLARLRIITQEIMPAQLRPQLVKDGNFQFSYESPHGTYNFSAANFFGKLQVEITASISSPADTVNLVQSPQLAPPHSKPAPTTKQPAIPPQTVPSYATPSYTSDTVDVEHSQALANAAKATAEKEMAKKDGLTKMTWSFPAALIDLITMLAVGAFRNFDSSGRSLPPGNPAKIYFINLVCVPILALTLIFGLVGLFEFTTGMPWRQMESWWEQSRAKRTNIIVGCLCVILLCFIALMIIAAIIGSFTPQPE